MVLTYDAYSETLESEKQKEDKLASIEERFNNMQLMIEKLIAVSTQVQDQQQFNVLAQSLFTSGMLKSEQKKS